METPADLLAYVSRALEELGLAHAVGGSIASMAYGEPRYTRDVDVVVELPAGKVARLLERFPRPDFYVDAELAARTAREGGQFNIIHPESGLKIDVYVPTEDLQRSQVANARRMSPMGVDVRISPPEELIVMKMQYYAQGDTDRHLRDITSMLRVSGPEIDRARIATLAAPLGLSHIWQAVLKRLDEEKRSS